MKYLAYVLRRLLFAAITLFGLSLLLFVIMRLLPGGPAQAMLGVMATPDQIAAIDAKYGLDQPVPTQYVLYLRGLVAGDLGESIVFRRPVSEVIAGALPVTLQLAAYVVVMSAIVTIALAWLAAVRRNGIVDHIVRAIPLIGIGMPSFWIGAMLLFGFALTVRAFPAGGYTPSLPGVLSSLFLPALTLTIGTSAILVRSLRLGLIEVLESDHILTARAKGIRGARLMLGHVLPNAAIPTLTVLNLVFVSLLGGTVVVESVFGLPGIGSLMISGFAKHDLMLVMGITMISAVLILTANLVLDVLYTLIDPRVVLR